MPSTIFDCTVIPFDGSDAAPSAVERIGELLTGNTVTFVMVLDQYVENALSSFAETEGLTVSQAAESAGERVVATATAAGVSASYRILTDTEVVAGLLRVADEVGATAIALPTHSKSGITRWLTGNMRDKIVQATSLPVLVLPGAQR